MRKGDEAEVLGSMSSPSPQLAIKLRGSLSCTMKKGYGLKRWKRIKRDVNKIGGCSIDTVKGLTYEVKKLDRNVSKKMQIFDDREKTMEGSFSSKNAVISSVDGFVPLHDLRFRSVVSSFASGTYSGIVSFLLQRVVRV